MSQVASDPWAEFKPVSGPAPDPWSEFKPVADTAPPRWHFDPETDPVAVEKRRRADQANMGPVEGQADPAVGPMPEPESVGGIRPVAPESFPHQVGREFSRSMDEALGYAPGLGGNHGVAEHGKPAGFWARLAGGIPGGLVGGMSPTSEQFGLNAGAMLIPAIRGVPAIKEAIPAITAASKMIPPVIGGGQAAGQADWSNPATAALQTAAGAVIGYGAGKVGEGVGKAVGAIGKAIAPERPATKPVETPVPEPTPDTTQPAPTQPVEPTAVPEPKQEPANAVEVRPTEEVGQQPVRTEGDGTVQSGRVQPEIQGQEVAQEGQGQAVPEGQPQPVRGGDEVARPDLANPGETEPVRQLVNETDAARNAAGEPKPRADSDVLAEAQKRVADNPDAEAKALLDAGANGRSLSTDVDTLAAKRVLNQRASAAISSGDPQAMAEATALADAWRRTGSEQARGFRQRFDPLQSPAERMRGIVVDMLTSPSERAQTTLDSLDAKIGKARTPEMAEPMKARRAKVLAQESERLARIADMVREAGLDPSVLSDERISDPATFAQVSRIVSAAQASLGGKLNEVWRNAILSAPTTHVVNTASNLAYGVFEKVLKEPIKATVNLALRDPDSPQFGDYVAYAQAFGPAISRAMRNSLRAFRTEMPVLESDIATAKGDTPHTAEGLKTEQGPQIGGDVGRVVRVPQRGLVAADELFKGFWATMEAAAEARRIAVSEGVQGEAATARVNELLGDYTSHAWESAVKEAEKLTFQQPLGPVGKAITKFRDSVPLMPYILPFIKAPLNIFKAGLSNTPLNVLKMGWRAARSLKNLKYDDGWRYEKSAINRDLVDTAVGTALVFGLWELVTPGKDGRPVITGSTPTDKGERELAYRAAPPTSIRIGDKWFDYSRVEPFATMLSTTVDLVGAVQRSEHGEDYGKALSDAVGTIKRQIKDKTFLKSIGDIIELVESADPLGTKASKFASNFASSWVPNFARSAARATDPNVREMGVSGTTVGDVVTQAMERTRQSALPVPSTAPPPKVDLWGRDVKRDSLGSPATDFAFRLLSPVQTHADQGTEMDRLILNWNNKHPDATFAPATPDRRISGKIGGEDYQFVMGDQEYHDYLASAGKRALATLTGMGLDSTNPSRRDIMAVQTVINRSHEMERNARLREHLDQVKAQIMDARQRHQSKPQE